jgi:hypothetical protein
LLKSETKEEVFAGSPLASFRYIHLATHGVYLIDLLFARPQDTAATLERDGLLTTAECYNLKLEARAYRAFGLRNCAGELKPSKGLAGLTRGPLFISGARSSGFAVGSSRPGCKQADASILPKFAKRDKQTSRFAGGKRNDAQKRLCPLVLLGGVCFDRGVKRQ